MCMKDFFFVDAKIGRYMSLIYCFLMCLELVWFLCAGRERFDHGETESMKLKVKM